MVISKANIWRYLSSSLFGLVLLLAFSIISSNNVYATHAMGIDIRYECVPGTNKYVVEVYFYRDCAGVSAPTVASVNVSSSNCGFNQNTVLPRDGNCVEVSPLCPPSLLNSTCSGGSLPGAELCIYWDTIDLGSNYCSDFTFSYTLCCRNNAITNLQNPGAQSQYVAATLDNRSGNCANNSAEFFAQPIPFICANQQFNYNHGASDVDGDSLVYKSCNPLTSGGASITHATGYSVASPITSNPAFSLDSMTGQLTMTPSTGQQAVVTMCIEEWRGSPPNDSIIGTTMRDIQIVVLTTCSNTQPTIDSIDNTYGDETKLGPWSVAVCLGDSVSFDFSAADNNGDNVSMNDNVATAIPDATFSKTGTAPVVTGTFGWRPVDTNDVGWNTFVVEVQDDGCPILGSNFYVFSILVYSGTTGGRDKVICGDSAQLNASGGNNFTWTAIAPATTAQMSCTVCPNPKALPPSNTQYIVTSDLSGSCDNVDTVLVMVPTPFTLSMSPDTTICLNSIANLRVTPSITRSFTYIWSDPDTTLSSDSTASTSAQPSLTSTYYVTVNGDTGCSQVDSVTVTISGVAPIVTASGSPDSICNFDTVQLLTAVEWNPACDTNTVWECASTNITGTIGNGVADMYAMSPYYRKSFSVASLRRQFIYSFGELSAMGLTGGSLIKGFGFNFTTVPDSGTTNMDIRMSCISDASFADDTFDVSTTYSVSTLPNQLASTGYSMWDFATPYIWDGGSHILIEMCTDDALPHLSGNAVPTQAASYFFKTIPQYRTLYLVKNGTNACSYQTGLRSFERPNIKFKWCGTAPPGIAYTWTPSSHFAGSDDTLQNPKVTPPTTTIYTVKVYDPNFPACPGEDFVPIFVGDTFDVVAAAADSIVCVGDGAQITATTNVSGNYTYNWSPGSPLNDSTILNPWAYPSDTTDFIITVNYIGCIRKDTVTIYTSPAAPSGLTISVDDNSICTGDTAQITVAGGGGGYQYSWTPTTYLSDSTSATPRAFPPTTATYLVYVQDGATGCDTALSVTINAGSPFPIDVTIDQDTVCPNDSVQLEVTSDSNFAFTYNWSPGTLMDDSTIWNPKAEVTVPTVFSVIVTRAIYGCDTMDSIAAYVDTIRPYIWGGYSVGLDTSDKVNDSVFNIKLSRPIVCSSITSPGTLDFDLDTAAAGTSTTTDFLLNSIDTAKAINCVGDTTEWVQIILNNPLPVGYMDDWKVIPHISTGVVDICGNLLDDNPAGIPNGWAYILPVELLYFTAELQADFTVLLRWEHADENLLDHYVVERSKDGMHYETIGKRTLAGNRYSYRLQDEQPHPGINYYRLKMVNKNGSFRYSNIQDVMVITNGFRFTNVSPIPTTNFINIEFFTTSTDEVTFDVFNVLGEKVRTLKVKSEHGNNNTKLEVDELEAGVYYLSMYYENDPETKMLKKIIKQ